MIFRFFITSIYIFLQVLAGFFHIFILVTFLAFLCHIFAPASIDPAVQHIPHPVKFFFCKRFSCGHDPKRDRMGILRHSRLHIRVFIIKESIPLIKMDSSPRKFFLDMAKCSINKNSPSSHTARKPSRFSPCFAPYNRYSSFSSSSRCFSRFLRSSGGKLISIISQTRSKSEDSNRMKFILSKNPSPF